MTLSYQVRIVCVGLASFFLINMAAGLGTWLLAGVAIRTAHRMKPSHAANLLLILRLLPSGFGILAVAAVCLPSYLQLEPEGAVEHVRLAFLAATLLGLYLWSTSVARGLLAGMRSRQFIRSCRREGNTLQLATGFSRVWGIEASTPFLALAGIFRPQLIVSRGMLAVLPPEELSAALRHEQAHLASRDNLKRLSMLLVPDILPWLGGFRDLERAWAMFTEWAADDLAAAGNASCSVALAAALVRVARMGRASAPCALVTPLVPEHASLPARVERLLSEPSPQIATLPIFAGLGLAVLAGLSLMLLLQPTMFEHAYRVIEELVNA